MLNRIIPPWSELNVLNRKLSKAEERLIRYLDVHLPEDWEIYVRPHLNGLVPDIVILHEQHGAQLFLVSDEDISRRVLHRDNHGRNQGRSSENLADTNVRSVSNDESSRVHPILTGLTLRNRILDFYIPELGEAFDWTENAYKSMPVSVFFANNSFSEIHDFIENTGSSYTPLWFGYDFLTTLHLKTIIPNLARILKVPLEPGSPSFGTRLRQLLNPPFHSRNHGIEVSLTPRFREIVKPKPGHHRVQGVAGSGKSFLIAHRAAAIANMRLNVLVICFNITLRNYLIDLINKCPIDFSWDNIRVAYFHGFLSDEAASLGLVYNDRKEKDTPIPIVLDELKEMLRLSPRGLYDAILIDEGQDFQPDWYQFLTSYLNQRNELLLVADRQQNIYGRDGKWTDGSMEGVQFRGPWAKLDAKSIRIPNLLAEKLNEFSRKYLDKNDAEMLESHEQDLFDQPQLIWEELSNLEEMHRRCVTAYRAFMAGGVHPSDVVFLVPDHPTGLRLVEVLESNGVKVNHIFSESQDTQRKHKFKMSDPRVKASTIHSFKGWELRCVILILTSSLDPMQNASSLVYTGLSRSQQNLCVLNLSQRFKGFGESWESLDSLEMAVTKDRKTAGSAG